jgi:hypothetical protein
MSASTGAGLVITAENITEQHIKRLIDYIIDNRNKSREKYAEKKGTLTNVDSKFIDDSIITFITPIISFRDKQYPTTLYNGLLEKLKGDKSLEYLVDKYRKNILLEKVGGRRRKTRRHRHRRRRQTRQSRHIFTPVSSIL